MKEALVFAAVLVCLWVLQPSTCDVDDANSSEALNTTGLPTGPTTDQGSWYNFDKGKEEKWLNKLVKNIVIFGIVACIIVAMFFLIRYYRTQRRTSRRKRYYQVSTSSKQDEEEEEADDEIEMSIYEKK